MHTHVFLFNDEGEFQHKSGAWYDMKAVMIRDQSKWIAAGWYKSLEDALAIEATPDKENMTEQEYEAALRAKIKALRGKAGPRASIKTLEAKVKELSHGNAN